MATVDTTEELRAVYSEAKKAVEGKLGRGRRGSIFKQVPYISPDWVQKYWGRYVHIASILALKGRPVGLSATLLILMETRSLVLDVYDVKKEGGENSAKILEQLSVFINVIAKLELIVKKSMPGLRFDEEGDGKESELPLLVLAPHLMLDNRLFPPKDHPGGGDHTELFTLCPDMAMGKKIMRACLQKGYDDLTCLLLTANAVGTLTMEILDKTNLRHRYYDRLSTCFSFCRMLAWAEVRRAYHMDLAKSKEWTDKVTETPSLCLGWAMEANALSGKDSDTTNAFEEAVIHRRRASSVSREPASLSLDAPPPSPASSFIPPPPSPQTYIHFNSGGPPPPSPQLLASPPPPSPQLLASPPPLHSRPPPPARGRRQYEEA